MLRAARHPNAIRPALALLLAAAVALGASCERQESSSGTGPIGRAPTNASPRAPSKIPSAPPLPSDSVPPGIAGAGASPAPSTSTAKDAPAAASTTAERPASVFSRIGLIGASATAGFGVVAQPRDPASKEMYSADLADVLIASSSEPITISRLGSVFFFSDPINHGRAAVDRLLQFKPTVIFGIDYLFWYGYGTHTVAGRPITRESERLELLEEGLRQADRMVALGVPIIVGDFPDMHDSIGHLLSAEQVPETGTLVKLNARLKEWADSHPNVRVLNLATLVPSLDRGDRVTLRGREWNCAVDGAILQEDRLHPTLVGCMAIASAACELAESCTEDGTCGTLVVEPQLCIDRLIGNMRGTHRVKDAAASPSPTAH